MSATQDLARLDAVGHAELVRTGEASARELVDAAIERIEARNRELNAVIWTRFEEARAEASGDLPDGPLRGVPFLLKDIGANQAGLPYYEGNRALRDIDHRSATDTVLGARFRAAGLVTLGKTNLPEMGTGPDTQPLAFGPTANPWDTSRSPSGSSGGSAAAVAAGLVPVAHANDGGGSIRLPASWCGLVGLKTTRGRMPYPESTSRNATELVVSRTVRDTAAVLDATHGHVPADLFQLAPPVRPYAEELGRDVEPLRVALLTDGAGYDVDPESVAAAELGAKLLEQLGHHVEPVGPDGVFGGDSVASARLWMAGIPLRIDKLGAMAGRELGADDVDPYNWAAAERGRRLSVAEYDDLSQRNHQWAVGVHGWFSDYDLLVTPTSGCPPMRSADLVPPAGEPWRMGRTFGMIGRFTMPFNVTGHPAISLPLHWTAGGLPVGTQLVAGMGREDTLLRLAAQLEQAAPWADRYPA